jgi:anti-sigma-K factor RskA
VADDKDSLAGEYVLGTLAAEERAEVARRMLADHELAAAVTAWQRRLAPFADSAAELAPSAGLLAAIEARLDAPAAATPRAPAMAAAEVTALRRRVSFWRGTTAGAAALAACLAVAVVAAPYWLAPSQGGHFVGMVSRDGGLPAMIVEVDTAEGTVSVRSVTAAAPSGRSLELWYVAEGRAPLSVGLIERAGATLRFPTGGLPGFIPASATFAVTEEPQGGAPEGKPTGPVIFSGKLIPAPD